MLRHHGSSSIWIRCLCMAALLLLISAKILAAAIMSGLELFHSEMPPHFGSVTLFNTVLYICLLTPLVLLSFASLSLLLAAYGRDEPTVRLSVALQAASWLFIVIGLAGYLFVILRYLSWQHVASWFYVYAAVQVELVATILLTQDTKRKIAPDREMQASLCPEEALVL